MFSSNPSPMRQFVSFRSVLGRAQTKIPKRFLNEATFARTLDQQLIERRISLLHFVSQRDG